LGRRESGGEVRVGVERVRVFRDFRGFRRWLGEGCRCCCEETRSGENSV
jgi:hypothetical protein